LIEQKLLAMLGTFWPEGTRLPPTPILARWMGTGERNTYLATRRLVEQGYLMARPGAGTVVIRTPVGSEGKTSSVIGKRVAIRVVKGRAMSVAESTLRGRLHSAGMAVVQMNGGSASDNNLIDADLSGFDALVAVLPNGYSPVRFDPRIPVLLLASSPVVTVVGDSGYDVVSPDDAQGSFLAGRHARELGCKTACFVGVADLAMPDEYAPISSQRLRGFEEGFGWRIPESRRLMTRRYTDTAGARAAQELCALKPLPDLVFAATDELAVGLIRRTAEAGLVAGKDFMLIGFDGHPRAAEVPGGPITTIARPERELGEAAADFLLDRLSSPQRSPRRLQLGFTLRLGITTTPISAVKSTAPQ
jgi:DNA-binding LacI/PurR family transcriptional regulator